MCSGAGIGNGGLPPESVVAERGFHAARRGNLRGLSVGTQRISDGSARVGYAYQRAGGVDGFRGGNAVSGFRYAQPVVAPRGSFAGCFGYFCGAVVRVIRIGVPIRRR